MCIYMILFSVPFWLLWVCFCSCTLHFCHSLCVLWVFFSFASDLLLILHSAFGAWHGARFPLVSYSVLQSNCACVPVYVCVVQPVRISQCILWRTYNWLYWFTARRLLFLPMSLGFHEMWWCAFMVSIHITCINRFCCCCCCCFVFVSSSAHVRALSSSGGMRTHVRSTHTTANVPATTN